MYCQTCIHVIRNTVFLLFVCLFALDRKNKVDTQQKKNKTMELRGKLVRQKSDLQSAEKW